MDTAVALVSAYLQVNGYFCVAEYPLIETGPGGRGRSVTDLDILAFRFPGAGREVRGQGRAVIAGDVAFAPDTTLGSPADRPDMIVGEVKRGRARFNAATRKPVALAGALMRFGCCSPVHAQGLSGELLTTGRARTEHGHDIRMIAFGGAGGKDRRGWKVIPLDAVVAGLRSHLREHWSTLRHAQFGNRVLDLFALVERSTLERDGKRGR